MKRLHLTFACGRCTLAATLDTAPGKTGLLIVSGGNEIRAGAASSQARLARAIAQAGFPVFRFDRRGIGDSEGSNRGFRASARDIASARDAFRALAPGIDRIAAFGNCDAASALMLNSGKGFDQLILANPWTIDEAHDAHEETAPAALPAKAIRQRYAQKLSDPREVRRLLSGGVSLGKLARGLVRAARPTPRGASGLAQEMRAGLDRFEGRVSILVASADRTAQVFLQDWPSDDPRIESCEGAGHAFIEPAHREWLEAKILTALRS